MCGRYQVYSRSQVQAIAECMREQRPLNYLERESADEAHDAFPKDVIVAIDSAFNVVELLWGFDVEWSRNPVFNTRVESIAEGSFMWQSASANGRCVIPAVRFYEPHMHERVRSAATGRAVKRPYLIGSQTGEPMLLAGISENGRCSIVTTQPNSSIAEVHDRMPLILRADEVQKWFDGELAELADRGEISLEVAPADDRPSIVESEQLGLF